MILRDRAHRARYSELFRMWLDGVTLSEREMDEMETLELQMQAEVDELKDLGPTERVNRIFKNMKLEPFA